MAHKPDRICLAEYECSICTSKTHAAKQARRNELTGIVQGCLMAASHDDFEYALVFDKVRHGQVSATLYDSETDTEIASVVLTLAVTAVTA